MAAGVSFDVARAPDGMRLYAVGDIHGRHDLLAAMHSRIMEEIMRDQPADWRIVYLGDYVDRGPDSKGVVTFLTEACAREERVIALAGNHDAGFLDFLASGDPHGMFANNGGFETGQSYGVRIDFASRESAASGHAALVEAVPEAHSAFMRSLALSASFGDFFFCHAGIRPGVALEHQSPEDLIWIRETFHRHTGLFEKVVVHGHTPVATPEIAPNRVNLDTGAWMSGRLTGLVIEGNEKRVIETRG